jgi:hypothetical protein
LAANGASVRAAISELTNGAGASRQWQQQRQARSGYAIPHPHSIGGSRWNERMTTGAGKFRAWQPRLCDFLDPSSLEVRGIMRTRGFVPRCTVSFDPGRIFRADRRATPLSLRLCHSNLRIAAIEEAVRRLARAWEAYRRG